jgi:NADH-quinone oxidoreductase subunit A
MARHLILPLLLFAIVAGLTVAALWIGAPAEPTLPAEVTVQHSTSLPDSPPPAPVPQTDAAQQESLLWPLLWYAAAVVVTVGGMIGVSALLGQRQSSRAGGEPYESGIVATSSARLRFSVQFYLVAILFVIFDLEAVFLIVWALAFREAGWIGYLGMLFFVGVLVVGLIYEWRQGSLDWGPTAAHARRRMRSDEERAR